MFVDRVVEYLPSDKAGGVKDTYAWLFYDTVKYLPEVKALARVLLTAIYFYHRRLAMEYTDSATEYDSPSGVMCSDWSIKCGS